MQDFKEPTFEASGLGDQSRVDREAGVIYGARAMQYGPLSEGDKRPLFVDDTTLGQVESIVNRNPSGLKMRFSHGSGLDAHLGKARNATIVGKGEGSYVAIDAAMSKASRRTPHGDLAGYVLDLANETPDDFGLSVAGTKFDMPAMRAAKRDDGKFPIRFKGLKAIDFAGEPAATSGGLFEIEDTPCEFADHAEWLLETHFSDLTREDVESRFKDFVNNYFASEGEEMADQDKAVDTRDERIAELEAKLAEATESETETVDLEVTAKDEARDELKRREAMTALCTLAKVDDATRDLMLQAEFTRQEAQEFLKTSGHLSGINIAIDEGGTDLGEKKKTPEDEYGAEFDEFADIYERQGLTRDDFIQSRLIDNN